MSLRDAPRRSGPSFRGCCHPGHRCESPNLCRSLGAAAVEIDAVHAVPGEVAQEALQPVLHSMEIEVVAEAALQRRLVLARLAVIDLPGMEIEDRRPPVAPVD